MNKFLSLMAIVFDERLILFSRKVWITVFVSESQKGQIFNLKFANINSPYIWRQSRKEKFGNFPSWEQLSFLVTRRYFQGKSKYKLIEMTWTLIKKQIFTVFLITQVDQIVNIWKLSCDNSHFGLVSRRRCLYAPNISSGCGGRGGGGSGTRGRIETAPAGDRT